VLAPSSPVTGLLELRPVAFIGGVSYGMYLYHMWCVHVAKALIDKVGLSQLWLQFPLALAGTIAVSAASYYLYEKRFLDLRKRFRK
jgi:peptidoglycan/LPS O-acetylase OafA/YrhL